ncbi:hypothetical protein BDD43_3519 [Mucilaginibacter gracilis]|uniref:Uncharacterized protein n=1 Tax=Mucilaginibacter gracilis TaxID=423350 RepID=A0A495J4Q0_9SPHI|nr:hypothetical protein [Mucilaginibacter gracilis]RKR83314.1 hypothetical protein BDD43_3519 [Mucilaginibacter gracilis]
METIVPELTAFDVVKIYEKNGEKITVDEAREVLTFMDKMIKLVKKELDTDENSRFIYKG